MLKCRHDVVVYADLFPTPAEAVEASCWAEAFQAEGVPTVYHCNNNKEEGQVDLCQKTLACCFYLCGPLRRLQAQPCSMLHVPACLLCMPRRAHSSFCRQAPPCWQTVWSVPAFYLYARVQI